MANETTPTIDKKQLEALVIRFGALFEKDKNYYVNDYGDRFKPTKDPETGKIKYHTQPGKYGKPFWFVEQTVSYQTVWQHLQQQGRGFDNGLVDLGLIMPPTNEEGLAKFGAIDFDKYKSPEDIKRVVKQIYDEKLPLAPCYSKSGGLHVYIFAKELLSAAEIVGVLKFYNKHLKINAKEVNPKQTQLKWNKIKKKFNPGNGILLPYKSCIVPKRDLFMGEWRNWGELISVANSWIKNIQMEKGTLLEFVDHAETIQIDHSFFGELPLNIKEETEEPKTPDRKKICNEEKRDFSESNARPLSQSLQQIILNIKKKKEHAQGGNFDWWIVDFVYGAMQSKLSDQHIHEHLKQFEDPKNTYDKSWKDYIQDKIKNCRDKYDKTDPGPLRVKFMEDTIFILKTGVYQDNSTKKQYDKESYNVKYAHIFPKKTTPTLHFKESPNKQLAEEETYRPDLYNENELLMKGDDGLYYLNKYKPGNKPIKPERVKDIKPFLDLVEHVIPNEEEREYFLDWLAFIVQKPWRKIKAIVVIYTKAQRMGKGSINDTMTDILGESNCEPTDVRGMLDKGITFAEKQLILIDECKSKGSYGEKANLYNDLKKIGTETRIQQRRLYVDYKVIETQTNYLVFTNLSDALNIEAEDERFFVVANENPRKKQSFYNNYHKWRQDKGSNYVHYWLKKRDLSKFNPMAPPPMTEGKKEMGKETGHPLTLKLRQMLDEGEHPLGLNVNVIGSTELAHYISKHHRGKHVQYANDTKQMKKSLLEISAVELGQVYRKSLDYKPSLFVIRDHEEMMKKLKSELCNEVWKPIHVSQPAEEKREEDRVEKFFNNQTEHAEELEQTFKNADETK